MSGAIGQVKMEQILQGLSGLGYHVGDVQISDGNPKIPITASGDTKITGSIVVDSTGRYLTGSGTYYSRLVGDFNRVVRSLNGTTQEVPWNLDNLAEAFHRPIGSALERDWR